MRNHPKAENPAEPPEMARVFFALWPDADVSQALATQAKRFQQRAGGRLMRPETLHMTLIFVGPVPRSRLPALAAVMDGVALRATTFQLARLAIWRHNRIGYAAPAHPLPEIVSVVATLGERLTQAGFRWDQKPFVPHVTLLRHVERCEAEVSWTPVNWLVSSLVLAESRLTVRGAQYLPLYRWPCQATR